MNTLSDTRAPEIAGKFHVVAYETGHTDMDLPLWTAQEPGAIRFDDASDRAIDYVERPEVPGAFQLLNVLSESECDQILAVATTLGFHEDAPVSLPRRIRHNNNFNWIVDESVDGPIWDRCKNFFGASSFTGGMPLGLNGRFRFYRYGVGDFFSAHTDGAWPDSRVVAGQLAQDAYGDRISEMTFLIFLSGGYEGGRTIFQTAPDTFETISTPKGAVLCFPHGMHPQHCVHGGEEVTSGCKDIIRTDVMYPWTPSFP